jgi:hypothetical protein
MEQHYEKFQRGYSPGKRYGRLGNESVTGTFTSTRSARSA